MLTTIVILLAAAAVAVPVTRRAGFGSVLGYLVAGIVIGPATSAGVPNRPRGTVAATRAMPSGPP